MQIKSIQTFTLGLLRLATALLVLFGILGFQPTIKAQALGESILYAQPSGLTSGICNSWANACDLQYALEVAVPGDQIWTMVGTYYPTSGTDRAATFTLHSGLRIYGGFNGTETLLSQRDTQANVTILSGDLGDPGDAGDNSYHVVTANYTNSSGELNGFTITAGNAQNDVQPLGGGILNQGGSPTLSNLILTGNKANFGGGMYNGNAHPTLTNVTFSNNSAARGGGMDNLSSNPLLTNVIFSDNHASSQGGGMSNGNSGPTLTNVTFSSNSAGIISANGWGGGMANILSSSPVLKNVTFSNNAAITAGGGIYNSNDSSPNLKHVTLSENSAGAHGGGIYNFANSEPVVITNSIVYGNSVEEIYDDAGTGSTVTYSIVQGGFTGRGNLDADPLLGTLASNGGYTQSMSIPINSPALNAADDLSCETTDQRGVSRPQGVHCDMGAYEYEDSTPPTVVSILRASANPTDADSVGFTVNFSEDVTGVDPGDFSFTTSGVTGASVTDVTGSGAAYTVTVSTGSGDGTLRLNVADDDSILDTLSNQLGGAGTGNGNFTTGEVYTVDKIADPPAATTPVMPTGNIGANYKPTYTWNNVSGGISGATWYYLWLNGPSGNLIHEWYEASAVCSSGTCSATPSKSLNPGNYTWWVQTWNSVGFGPWSASTSFTIPVPAAPGTTTLVSPEGTVTNTSPTYTWNKVSDATWYYLWVNGPSGNVLQKWYDTSAACGASTCSVTPAISHAPGHYTWWVRPYNPGGTGPWSASMNFTIPVPAAPGATTLVSPEGSIGTNKPAYTWNDVPGATWYYLWVNGPSGNVIKKWYSSGDAACNGTTCSLTPNSSLASGAHTWWVQTWNAGGFGPWSISKTFNTP